MPRIIADFGVLFYFHRHLIFRRNFKDLRKSLRYFRKINVSLKIISFDIIILNRNKNINRYTYSFSTCSFRYRLGISFL